MFAIKTRKELEIAVRVLLIAAIMFNALALNPTPVEAEQETVSTTVGQLESRSIPTFPTFERPEETVVARNESHTDESAPMPNSTYLQSGPLQMYTATGEEGLRLSQNWVGGDDSLAADWIVQKSTGSNNKETLVTFYSSLVPKPSSVLSNFVGTILYTVKPTEAGPNNWISFQLAGIKTQELGFAAAGGNSARFFVDISSQDSLPVTCDNNNSQGYLTVSCVQDSVSHVHGMSDSGPVGFQYLSFNDGGGWARVAVKGLTAGQVLIVTFYTPINNLNTLSSCALDGCLSAATRGSGHKGRPINTRTGNYEYFTEDISIPTSAGNLGFTRDYVSATTSLNSPLSPGWTHNLDTRLIFHPDPEGLSGKVVFKAHTANKYVFTIDSVNNVYAPEPGLQATLVKNAGTPITYTLKTGSQKTYTFDATGKLLNYADEQGHTWTYTYASGKLDRVTADGGKYLDLDYDSQGRVNLVKDHTNRSVSYAYNASGDLVTFTDVMSQNWTYEYHPTLAHLLTRVAAPGNVTVERQEYYANGKAWKQFDGNDDLIVELIYNSDGTTTAKDALNNIETHTYNDRSILVVDTNAAGGNLRKQYDFNFQPSVITDPLGNPTNLKWSDNGTNLNRVTDALQNTTNIMYGTLNNPTSIVDPRTYETKYFYLDANFPTLPTRIEYPLLFPGETTNIHTDYEYYPPASGAFAGKVKFETDALGNKTYFEYNTAGQTTKVVTGHGTANALTTLYNYDSLGRLTDTTDPQNLVTHNEYDNAGRLTKTTHNVHATIATQNYQDKYNIVTEYRYDLRGNQIAVIDTYGTITRTYYDLDNRPVTVVQNLYVTGTLADVDTPIGSIPSFDPLYPDRNIRTITEYDDAGNVIVSRDPAGIITRTYYDSANRPKLAIQNWAGTNLYGDISTAPVYNAATPDQNIRTEYFYDLNSNVIATKDTLGVVTRTYYDELNRPKAVIQNLFINGTVADINTPLESVPAYTATYPDRNLRTDTYYDKNGNVIVTVDPNEAITRTYYDSLNRPTNVVQNFSGTVANALNSLEPPTAGTSDSNIRTDTYYDKAGNVIATVDPRGKVTRTYYDSVNRLFATVQNLVGQDIYVTTPPARGSGGPDENIRTDIAYDSSGRRDITTDPLGRVTKYEYNEAGQLFKVTGNYVNGGSPQNEQNQRNIVMTYEYDALGRQVQTTDTLGRIVLTTYDDLSRVLTTTQNYLQGQPQNYKDPVTGNQYNLTTTFTYDVRSNQMAATDTKGVVARTYYDALSRPVTVVRNSTSPTLLPRGNPVDPLANLRTDTVYLGNGSVDYVEDELGEKTDYGYDALGRLTSVLDPLLNPTNYEYNANGSRTLTTTFVTATQSVATKYEYDDLNRLKVIIENNREDLLPFKDTKTNVRTEYTYDAAGNRLSIRDGESFLEGRDYRTLFTYDALGRLKTEKDPLNNETVYGYDKLGNRISLLDAKLQTTSFGYDELNRLELINYPSPDADVNFDYDALGRRTSMTDGLGTTSWNYTNIDQPKLITDPFGTAVSYDYDALGNRTALSYGSQSYAYQYNDLNQLDEVTGSGLPNPVTYQYDPAGRLKNVDRPNGVDTLYNYFDNGWLKDITHGAGTTTVAFYQYQYYMNGNRSQAIENVQNPQLGMNPSPGAMAAMNPQPVASGANVSYNPASQNNRYASAEPQIDFGRLPLSFAANLGQFDKDVKFQTNSLGGSIYFTPSEVVLMLVENKKSKHHDEEPEPANKSKVIRIEYPDAEKDPSVEGLELLPGVANFMVGSDKKAWVANAPTYGGVLYRELYPGIDLRYEGAEGNLKSTFTVAVGGNPALIQWQYKDAGELSLDAAGNLRITLPAKKADETTTTLVEHAPIAWQEQDGQRVDVPVQYSVTPKGEIGFLFPQGYNASLPLTIDPTLTYSTYLGGDGTDRGYGITTDTNGNAYLTGYSYCGDFPTENPIQQGGAGGRDVIISKLSADGSDLLYSTCVGGTTDDVGYSVALDSQNRIVVVGETDSTDFPIVSGISTYGGGTCTVDHPCQDLFVLELNETGSAIRFSTYLGGNGRETVGGAAVNGNDQIIVVGSTASTNYPTVNAYDTSFGAGTCSGTMPCYDVAVTRIDPAASGTDAIKYSTYLGTDNRDSGLALTLDPDGKVYLTGYSEAAGYPTRNALQATHKDSKDLIITQLDTTKSGDESLLYSTYLGNTDGDYGYGIARDTTGNLYLTGRTASAKFPLRDPLQHLSHASSCGSSTCYEAFVTKLNIATNTILYSTYLGGSQNEEAYGIAVDSYGRAYVTGFTRSTDFPTAYPIQGSKGGDECSTPPCADAFLSVLEPDGRSFAYSTFLGGEQEDIANSIRLDVNNNAYVVGETSSTTFPTTLDVYDDTNDQTAYRDAFVVKVDALSAPSTPTATHLDVAISASSDDAEERGTGSMTTTSNTLELVTDTTVQKVGLRFTGLNIPQGAIIQNAWVQFTVDAASTDTANLTIQAQASDNASTFTTTSNNISSRALTSASAAWSPALWNTTHEGGPDQRTPNLASVVQEVVDRPGWTSGNALAIIITGSGKRSAKSFDRDMYGAPYLHIEYTLPTPPPTVTPTFTPTATATATAIATATPTATATASQTPTATPTPIPSGPVTITYIYDPLNRLTEANYSNNDYYHYTYDAVGNRETQQKSILGFVTNDTYVYDDANRLTSLNGLTYTWDNNGNLKKDGVNAYEYDSANRLIKTCQDTSSNGICDTGETVLASYVYNGLNDRLQETVNGSTTTFTMDLNVGLTQALSDGTNAYIYGNGRIAQAAGMSTEYFLGDALGSVRQLTSASGAITYAKAYDPYGVVTSTTGSSPTAYGYTGEFTSNNLVYLRARQYAPDLGRFLTRDTWEGIYSDPITLNKWAYAHDNPVLLTDPSGNDPITLIILALIGLGIIAGTSGCDTPYIQITPTPTLVPHEERVRQIEALAIKYGISLPDGVGWGYFDESDYPVDQHNIPIIERDLGRSPNDDEKEDYSSTGEREILYDNKVYLTNFAFELNQIKLVGVMVHEARHAYQEESQENLGNPLNLPDGSERKAVTEADAYTVEKMWLEQHGETLDSFHQGLLDQYRRNMPNGFTLPLPLPLPFK